MTPGPFFNACDYLLDRHVREGRGDRLALTGVAGDISYAELAERVAHAARGLRRLGLQAEQRVTVSSEVGQLPDILVRSYADIKPSNVLMYYPEANVLVPRHVDPASKTPAFKSILVHVEARSRVPAAARV